MKNSAIINFPELTFTEPGDYKYIVKEITPTNDEWEIDKTEFPVIIHVTDDGEGNLVAKPEYPNGIPEFVNTLKVELSIVKEN